MGVAVDLAGQVFVADSDADRVVVLRPDGQKLSNLGGVGTGARKIPNTNGA